MRKKIRMDTVKKVPKNKTKNCKMPKLIQIGNSVGLVISKIMLQSICWKKGDFVEYQYDGGKKRLTVRNFSAEQRDFDAIHGENRTNY